MGTTGVGVLADSSVRVVLSGSVDSVSIPENVQIAMDMVTAAETGLAAKGYATNEGSLFSVGASFAASKHILVKAPGGNLDSPRSVGKPFIVRPEPSDTATAAKMNELFHWARKASGTAPRTALDILRTPGLVLVSCMGGNKTAIKAASDTGVSIRSFKPGTGPGTDAWSEVELVVLDGSTGKVAWLERGSVKAFTPQAVAAEIKRLIEALPSAE